MTIPDYFKQLGLSSEKATLYLTLLNSGPQTAISLAKLSGIKRTYVYHLSQELAKENLIKLSQKGRTTFFTALSPDTLLARAEERQTQARLAMAGLESALPELQSKFHLSDAKPTVRYYEGATGNMKANREVLAEKKEILAYLVVNKDIDTEMADYWKEYYDERIKNNIHVRAITSDTAEGKEYKMRDSEELRETKLVPADQFPLAIEKNIVGDKVVFFSTVSGVLVSTIIDNKEIADTERAIFELAWKQASKYDNNLK
jgi:sugar-specific transcriptional regulator TrmB